MIDDSTPIFPVNVQFALMTGLRTIDPDVMVLPRLLRPSDPVQCIGVAPQTWGNIEDSMEMRGPRSAEPTLQRYTLSIQSLVRDMDPDRGAAIHSILATRVRSVLYRNTDLAVMLRGLEVVLDGTREHLRRHGLGPQRFLSAELPSGMNFLSTLDFWFETEIM